MDAVAIVIIGIIVLLLLGMGLIWLIGDRSNRPGTFILTLRNRLFGEFSGQVNRPEETKPGPNMKMDGSNRAHQKAHRDSNARLEMTDSDDSTQETL